MVENVIKTFGKVYTPAWVVNYMLTPLFERSLKDVHICDPACGAGDFLVPTAKQICERAIKASKIERLQYINTLKQLTGYDIDQEAVKHCRERLSSVSGDILGQDFPHDFWRVREIDAMDAQEQDQERFDWVVGNPPYVRIQHLESDRRDKIKRAGWSYFYGSSDLYIVFFELGLRLLKKGGNLRFISPSGWIRNDAGKPMRKDLETKHEIVSLCDFRDFQAFPSVSTYTCITHICKNGRNSNEKIRQWDGDSFSIQANLVKSEMRWAVVDKPAKMGKTSSMVKLSDIADIRVGIQTLADKVFILELLDCNGKFITVKSTHDQFDIERMSVKRILKASVLKKGKDKISRVIIYPYNDKGKLIPEDEFSDKFPCAYQWLFANKDQLLSRDKGAFCKSKWYGFGREVGIRSAFGRKILTSGMNPKPNFQICNDPDTLFYSGYCIKPHNGIKLVALQKVLNSPDMDIHIKTFSQPFRGGWYSYAKRYISDFPIKASLATV
ncbi:MAG: Eco57I restriction-modification methylase domain-containing protein [Bacteroidetes bacterium]|nr:Eco57I restriction-modification methylase domain-containing protein [Bacteroidota bacterium]MCY4204578.1 Eco57I restriction-modification methylase domain-containing protein [Bacteroidota bacterium]